MNPDIRWIIAVYGTPESKGEDRTHIGVPENGRAALQEMALDLVGTGGLVALYVPEGTEDVYNPGGKRGRVIGAVELVPMPPNGRMEDYFYDDWDGSRRWPIGWPSRLVYAPPVAECPRLREHVESLFGAGSFRGYASRFQKGPFLLEPAMRSRLSFDFAQLMAVQ